MRDRVDCRTSELWCFEPRALARLDPLLAEPPSRGFERGISGTREPTSRIQRAEKLPPNQSRPRFFAHSLRRAAQANGYRHGLALQADERRMVERGS